MAPSAGNAAACGPGHISSCRHACAPKNHVNIKILRSGPEAQDKGDSRRHDLQHTNVCALWAPNKVAGISASGSLGVEFANQLQTNDAGTIAPIHNFKQPTADLKAASMVTMSP